MISQTVEYALRALVFLASNRETKMKTQQISESTHVPLSYLRKIMQQLGKAGFVNSERGKDGGFILKVPAENITVLEIINAIDPIRIITHCPLKKCKTTCQVLCPLHKMLQDVAITVENKFATVFLGDLVKHSQGCQALIRS